MSSWCKVALESAVAQKNKAMGDPRKHFLLFLRNVDNPTAYCKEVCDFFPTEFVAITKELDPYRSGTLRMLFLLTQEETPPYVFKDTNKCVGSMLIPELDDWKHYFQTYWNMQRTELQFYFGKWPIDAFAQPQKFDTQHPSFRIFTGR